MIISSTLLVVAVLINLECLIQLVSELPDVGNAHYTLFVMFQYVVMNLPAILYMMFPIAAFIGCLLGLGRLATGSELTVMQANGVSKGQITWSVIKAAIIMSLVVSVIGEVMAPRWQMEATAIKERALNKRDVLENTNQIWLHYNNVYLYIDHVIDASHISRVSEFIFQGDKLQAILFAKSGNKINNHWVLHYVSKTILDEHHTEKQQEDTEALHFNFVPNKLQPFNNGSLQGSVVDLWHTIQYRHSAGLLATLFQLTFWQRVIQPVTTLIMICLGALFVFGSLRNVSATIRLVFGLVMGIIFYMLNRFFGPITLIYQLPPFLGAICPTLFFLSIYIYTLLRHP
jgi:lipopolysaccharide export system permease protein